jgi:hypothetical protein
MFDAFSDGLGFFAQTATAIFLEASPFLLLGRFWPRSSNVSCRPSACSGFSPGAPCPGSWPGWSAG